MTKEQIAELRALDAAATKGPWAWVEKKWNDKMGKRWLRRHWVHCLQGRFRQHCIEEHADVYDYDSVFGLRWDQVKTPTLFTPTVMRDEDKALIAGARNALAPLLDEIERLQAENAALRKEQA